MVDKKNNLNLVIEQIKKQTKDPNAIMRLGDNKKLIKNIDVISTGSISLDIAVGIGGVPK
jgi:recombination protein RecA